MKKIFAMLLALAMLLTTAAMAETLTMGSSCDFPPYEYYHDETGEIVSGKVDFGMSGFTVTEERKQNVDFSTSYTTAKQSVLVPADTAITTVDDILNPENEYKIGVQIGTTGDLYITGDVESLGLKHSVERFNKYHDAFAALASGKIDCIIVDDQVGIAYVNANEGMKILDTAYAFEEYAICFAKESDLFAPFDAALQELIADGTVQAIIDKYIAG